MTTRDTAKNELLFPCHSKKPTKQSNVTRMTNKNILSLFIILVLMSIACAAGNFVISVSPLRGASENRFVMFCKY